MLLLRGVPRQRCASSKWTHFLVLCPFQTHVESASFVNVNYCPVQMCWAARLHSETAGRNRSNQETASRRHSAKNKTTWANRSMAGKRLNGNKTITDVHTCAHTRTKLIDRASYASSRIMMLISSHLYLASLLVPTYSFNLGHNIEFFFATCYKITIHTLEVVANWSLSCI